MHTYIQTHLFQNVVLFRPHKFKRLPTLKVPNARGTILNSSEFIVISSVDVGGISGHIWTLSPNSSVEMDSEAGQWQSIYLRSRCKSSAEWESTRSTSFNVFKWIIPNILTKSIVFLTAPINSLMLLPCWCGAKCGAGCDGVMQCPMRCPLDLLRPGHCTILLQAQPNLTSFSGVNSICWCHCISVGQQIVRAPRKTPWTAKLLQAVLGICSPYSLFKGRYSTQRITMNLADLCLSSPCECFCKRLETPNQEEALLSLPDASGCHNVFWSISCHYKWKSSSPSSLS